MTNKEALIAEVLVEGVSDNTYEKALLDANLNGTQQYASVNDQAISLAAIAVLQAILPLASQTEGGYSITFSVSGIKARLAYLQDKTGTSTGAPTIRGVSAW